MSIEELAAIFEDPARDTGANVIRDALLAAVNETSDDSSLDAMEMFEGFARALARLSAGAGDEGAAGVIEYVYQRTHQLCEQAVDGAAKHVMEE